MKTEIQHTPGPWKAERDVRHYTNNGTFTEGSPKAWAVYGEGMRICKISSTIGKPWDKDERAEANAHLIAAAPDLLDALKRILDYTDALDAYFTRKGMGFDELGQDAPTVSVAGQARAAIAKAQGRDK